MLICYCSNIIVMPIINFLKNICTYIIRIHIYIYYIYIEIIIIIDIWAISVVNHPNKKVEQYLFVCLCRIFTFTKIIELTPYCLENVKKN